MRRARAAILAQGGAANTNVFTRALLALFGALPWRARAGHAGRDHAFARWFPFHVTKISYWSRTVLTAAHGCDRLEAAGEESRATSPSTNSSSSRRTRFAIGPAGRTKNFPGPRFLPEWTRYCAGRSRISRRPLRRRAIGKAAAFVEERLNGEDGLGAIFPAMTYSALMFDALGYQRQRPEDGPGPECDRQAARRPRRRGLLPALCLAGVGHRACLPRADGSSAGKQWRRVFAPRFPGSNPCKSPDVAGDWAAQKPHVRPGGWAFQYANAYYPDVDDTAVVAMAMDRAAGHEPEYKDAVARAREWIEGLQSANGGWGAFDSDNDREYLNYIPFADHGALLDPPTADVTARCLSMLGQFGETRRAIQRSRAPSNISFGPRRRMAAGSAAGG